MYGMKEIIEEAASLPVEERVAVIDSCPEQAMALEKAK
jgi:hypothetical protein